jgi:chloramphenicol O-acetyltransferase type A
MKVVPMESWPRREIFAMFAPYQQPFWGLCAEVEVARLRSRAKAQGFSFYHSVVYCVMRAANADAPFRYRIRGSDVVEHEMVHPSFTVAAPQHLFNLCMVRWDADFEAFVGRCAEAAAAASTANHLLLEADGQDDLVYITCLPWLSFTGMRHALPGNDSVPRIAWGKCRPDGFMPIQVDVHHGLVDGVDVARFLERLQSTIEEVAT